MTTSPVARRTGRFALLSGAIGLVAIALLLAALAAPTPEPDTMRRETVFFAWQDVGVILQALAMMPVTIGIWQLAQDSSDRRSCAVLGIGLFGQISLVISSVLIFTHTASDMLYMAPIGLVGLWLMLVNNKRQGIVSKRLCWTGRIAGAGLLTVGIGFLIYGTFVAPAVFIRPLTNAEIDAQALSPANLVAHICMAVGTVLGRVIYPIWAVLMGRRVLQLSYDPS